MCISSAVRIRSINRGEFRVETVLMFGMEEMMLMIDVGKDDG